MSMDYSLSSLAPAASMDMSSAMSKNLPEQTRIEKVSKAMEGLFISQLTAEFGKGIDESSDSSDSTDSASGGPYSDFIQQAMTLGVSNGGGFGLAKIIENYLTQRDHPKAPAHLTLKVPNTSYHVNHVE